MPTTSLPPNYGLDAPRAVSVLFLLSAAARASQQRDELGDLGHPIRHADQHRRQDNPPVTHLISLRETITASRRTGAAECSAIEHELPRGQHAPDEILHTYTAALREFLQALSRARRLIHSFGADVVVSAGGYASAPMAVAAIIGGTPLILMEQNTQPGLANRMLWRFARKVCVGFADAADAFNDAKIEVTGNPVRFSKMPQPARRHAGPLQILVLGGSSGAHRLNLGVLSALKILHENPMRVAIIHQTGEADARLVEEAYRALGGEAKVVPFIDDIAAALDWADLIIARAGAMTVSDIALAGRPAVFIPYPFHRDHQQELNARVLVRVGGALIVADDEHLGENLAQTLQALSARPECLQEMGHRAHQASIGDAAGRIVRLCFQIADNHTSTGPSVAEPVSRGRANTAEALLSRSTEQAEGKPQGTESAGSFLK